MIKNFVKVFTLTLVILVGTSLPAHTKKAADVHSIYLTWDNEDTATTMVVKILTLEKPKNPRLIYGTAVQTMSRGGSEVAETESRAIATTPIHITSFSLKNLSPDTVYFFNYKDETHQLPKENSFRTLPNTNKPVEFLQGGDLSASNDVERVAQQAVTNDTMAYVIGGDIAYENGVLSSYNLYLKWFTIMNRAMKAPDGRLIPLILAVGNHEVNGKQSADNFVRSPFYLNLFLQNNGRSFFKRNLGAHSTIFALDSGHITPHGGIQRDWLEAELQNTATPNKFAVYHVPMYPTYRDYDGSLSAAGRKHWLPLFDKYELTVGFENHDHTLKRTHMLKENKKVTSDGTVYVGDGCWGAGARPADKRWYHHIAESKLHIWRILADKDSVSLEAIGKNGETLDQFSIENREVVKN